MEELVKKYGLGPDRALAVAHQFSPLDKSNVMFERSFVPIMNLRMLLVKKALWASSFVA